MTVVDAAHAALTDAFRLRAMEKGDVDFVLGSWLHAQRHVPPFERLDNRTYYTIVRDQIIDAMRRSSVVLACPPDDHDVLCGFAAAELPDVLHYVYVRKDYRRLGLATLLVGSLVAAGAPLRATMQWHGPVLRSGWRVGKRVRERKPGLWQMALEKFHLTYDPKPFGGPHVDQEETGRRAAG